MFNEIKLQSESLDKDLSMFRINQLTYQKQLLSANSSAELCLHLTTTTTTTTIIIIIIIIVIIIVIIIINRFA